MIYDALVVPTETPPSLLELKRALLTYDKIVLVEPDDRDIMPTNAFMSAIMGVPLIGIDTGPVRPMGKVSGYDDMFSQLLEDAKPAVSQGLVDVRSTYQRDNSRKLTIGSVQTGGYPLDTQLVFRLYRSMASDTGFLHDSLKDNSVQLLEELERSPELALSGRGDAGNNNITALPQIDMPAIREDERTAITNIARSRIAGFIKYAGFCDAKNLVPIFSSGTYGNLTHRLLNNTEEVLSSEHVDPFWGKRNRVLELCHEEFLVDRLLDELSVDEVIRLRSKAWGYQARAREELFKSIFRIAEDFGNTTEFEKVALPIIHKYRKNSEDLIRERNRLGFQIKCDIGKGVLAGGAGLIGLLSQLESPFASIGLTLVAGGIWAFDKAKNYVPALRDIKAKESEMKRGAGFGLHNFYSSLHG